MRGQGWLLRGWTVPAILLAAAAGVVAWVQLRDQAPRSDITIRLEPVAPQQDETGLWRCHACARSPQKAWIPCRTVTGRGSKAAALERVEALACEEVGVARGQCQVTTAQCRRITEADLAQPARGDDEPPE